MKIDKTASLTSQPYAVDTADGTALVRAVKKLPQKILAANWALNDTTSSVVDLEEFRAVGLSIPAGFTGTNITPMASTDGLTFKNIYDATGAQKTITCAADRRVVLNPADYYGVRYLKFVTVAQAAATSINVIAEA